MAPMTRVSLQLVKSGRDQLAADLRDIEAGLVPGIAPEEVAKLRARLAELDEVIRKHKAMLN